DVESKMSPQNYTTLNTGVLMYDTHANRWQVIDQLPPRVPTVTSPTAFDGRRWMVINGEVAPATRTNRVVVIQLAPGSLTQPKTGPQDAR
ncbi:MAG TPA: hypothetical protein VG722_11940, partial [Tepidisphaeraceae bacterium]|nr:hypothetical protein [Tepidisphaeraceae bacterium]